MIVCYFQSDNRNWLLLTSQFADLHIVKQDPFRCQAKAKQEEADKIRAREALERREKDVAELKKRVAELEAVEN